MTNKQKEQFNLMLTTLKRISEGYKTSYDLLLESTDSLFMAYDHIQDDARVAIKWVERMK